MKITFYGARGSISVSGKDYVEFGGNTSCALMEFGNGRIGILDAGTGLRELGNDIIKKGIRQDDGIFIALSHTHWDHIQGFPFFKPAYDPSRKFTVAISGKGRKGTSLETLFETQMQQDFFPAPLDGMGAAMTFWEPKESEIVGPYGVHVNALRHNHPGGAYSYRIEEGGKVLVYCTDVEHGDDIDPNIVQLASNADLLIHDAQYKTEELADKKGWGHSTWNQAVEVAKRAGVKKLALYHHDPERTDQMLREMEAECQQVFPQSFFAREGADVEL